MACQQFHYVGINLRYAHGYDCLFKCSNYEAGNSLVAKHLWVAKSTKTTEFASLIVLLYSYCIAQFLMHVRNFKNTFELCTYI